MRRLLSIAVAGFILAAAIGVLGTWGGLRWYEAPGPSTAPKTIVLEPRGTEAIGGTLEGAGILTHVRLFMLAARLSGGAGELKAGEYLFPAGISPAGILDLLRSGRTVVHRLVVPEGLTSPEIVALVNEADALTGEIAETPAEGQLLPATYFYSRGDKRQALVDRMHRGMTKLVGELWAQRRPGLPLGNPAEAVTLASMVEKETGVEAERPLIAGVFYNRLKLGMRLQSDPTVSYALTQGEHPLGRTLSHADLELPSPYNTYVTKGLPPGPIANPGKAALKAVLDPAATDALYFVADGSGGHRFSTTLDEHNRAVQHWREIQTPKN
ncbi:aminodeoxychorismate lyase [Aliidongia dinghuensis]|uniref:Endolytic murein transglycosylase n=1 Tax=Aliidongia dinghuensis TaxID=1867774 RepID=A0A8J2YVN5_9PROT|nr:endolytic transglycosylase MltG [Aliidongia dinghuensis]GGF25163.1 aminodeoxychorismate lyase [Aliidongia dinghuensis]